MMTDSNTKSSRPEISAEMIKDIYPLNKMSPAELARLQPGMRMRNLRSGRGLFAIGDVPEEYFYILEGSLQLSNADESILSSISAGTGEESIPLPYIVPSMERAYALTDCKILAVQRKLLDSILHVDDAMKSPEHHHAAHHPKGQDTDYAATVARAWLKEKTSTSGAAPAAIDQPKVPAGPILPTLAINGWQTDMLHSPGYQRVPQDCIEEAFAQMERVDLKTGDFIVEQGQPADYFYVIANGHCEVIHKSHNSKVWTKVSAYGPGGTVGEDALISNLPRNASVRMTTDGRVMRLDGKAFRKLIKPYLARPLPLFEALEAVAEGAQWLDIRMPNEVKGRRIRGAVAIPHPIVRAKLLKVDYSKRFIVVCADQTHSPVIAYMLSKYDLDAYYLQGGIEALPIELLEFQ